MITRLPLLCLACSSPITARIQVGHEKVQPISFVCPECFTPIRLRLLLDEPPRVGYGFDENCMPTDIEGRIVNVGAGYMIPRAQLHEDAYFPSMDLPKPDQATTQALLASKPEGFTGVMVADLFEMLGGMRNAQEHWRNLWNAHRFHKVGQLDRMRGALREIYGDPVQDEVTSVGEWIYDFVVRFMDPLGPRAVPVVLAEMQKAYDQNEPEFARMLREFRPVSSERIDNYMDVLNQFFRAYGEFNQALLYVRLEADPPNDAYAPSIDFESTRMYYGEAFEALGSGLDFPVAVNNVLSGRPFDQLQNITLKQYRASDKGRRNETLMGNPALASLVGEYDNGLRNASHHRWLRLNEDRSRLSYRAGGTGQVRALTYAEYLTRCCAITSQLTLLLAVELAVLVD